jgi:hypothetical protein
MLRRAIAVVAPVLSLTLAPPLAHAATTQHALKLTIRDSTISSQGDSPGNRQTTAGLVSGNPIGHGVESISDKVTSATSATIILKGTIAIYTTRGIMTGTIDIHVTPTSNGGATATGDGKITGGSGRYARAHGKFTFAGGESSNSSVFVSHITGTVSF